VFSERQIRADGINDHAAGLDAFTGQPKKKLPFYAITLIHPFALFATWKR
jgi:hypothetical protein